MFLDNPEYPELNQVIDRLAKKYDVTPVGIATAWITRHPAGMQVVLGTTKPERVRAAAAGSDITLERSEWYELFRAAGYRVPEHCLFGQTVSPRGQLVGNGVN